MPAEDSNGSDSNRWPSRSTHHREVKMARQAARLSSLHLGAARRHWPLWAIVSSAQVPENARRDLPTGVSLSWFQMTSCWSISTVTDGECPDGVWAAFFTPLIASLAVLKLLRFVWSHLLLLLWFPTCLNDLEISLMLIPGVTLCFLLVKQFLLDLEFQILHLGLWFIVSLFCTGWKTGV